MLGVQVERKERCLYRRCQGVSWRVADRALDSASLQTKTENLRSVTEADVADREDFMLECVFSKIVRC